MADKELIVRVVISRDPGSLMYNLRIEGTKYTAVAHTLWGARRKGKKMADQYTRSNLGPYREYLVTKVTY